jgi:eukaryotic translation initiation factor 2C
VKSRPSYKRGSGVGSVERVYAPFGSSLFCLQCLKDISEACSQALALANAPPDYKKPPDIVLVILPQSAAEIRQSVKRTGDVIIGVGIVTDHNF